MLEQGRSCLDPSLRKAPEETCLGTRGVATLFPPLRGGLRGELPGGPVQGSRSSRTLSSSGVTVGFTSVGFLLLPRPAWELRAGCAVELALGSHAAQLGLGPGSTAVLIRGMTGQVTSRALASSRAL